MTRVNTLNTSKLASGLASTRRARRLAPPGDAAGLPPHPRLTLLGSSIWRAWAASSHVNQSSSKRSLFLSCCSKLIELEDKILGISDLYSNLIGNTSDPNEVVPGVSSGVCTVWWY